LSWHSTRKEVDIIDSNNESHEYLVQFEVIASQAFEDGRLTTSQDQALREAGGVFLSHSIRSRSLFQHIPTVFDRLKSKNVRVCGIAHHTPKRKSTTLHSPNAPSLPIKLLRKHLNSNLLSFIFIIVFFFFFKNIRLVFEDCSAGGSLRCIMSNAAYSYLLL
jgi:hypothetical protein